LVAIAQAEIRGFITALFKIPGLFAKKSFSALQGNLHRRVIQIAARAQTQAKMKKAKRMKNRE